MTPQDIVVWTPGNNRIWWACPTCKVEGGVTLPVPLAEIQRRSAQFAEAHKDCAAKAQEGKAWRG